MKKLVVCIAIFVAIFVGVFHVTLFNDHDAVITVTDKNRVVTDETSKYLIYGENENGDTVVYENTDSLFRGKFNSSDIYGEMKEGRTYEVKLVGYRLPFLSSYENILDCKEVSDND